MPKIVVERLFDEPVAFEDLQKMEDNAQWCLELYNVKFLQSLFAADRKRMICVYEAPDAEAVRSANRKAGLPFEAVWSADVFEGRR
ncbi:MAG: DUF4242 domain-containing protein [Proteobacteria bacterium]|nr:DUF4242 domain-containing protein [Pseudomonadota bacterium]MDA1058895.1 DUF4242 domain-containing protein [Pseudomonadota bacterium]